MPKSPNQKLKLLYLSRILQEETDEAHPMTVNQMIAALAGLDILAERKSIYDDLEALRRFGLDIIQVRGKSTAYYVASRAFELPELKLLVDIIQSSKFITRKKTLSLIGKIERLASVHDARLLQRQVFVRNRVKSMNESVYYNVDELSAAITDDKMIKFKYYEYSVSRERCFRRGGEYYVVSPFALTCDDENYYLLAYASDTRDMRHYRVDKMTMISALPERRQGKEEFEKIDMSSYSQHVFGMFSGEEKTVRLRFSGHLAGAVIDRFGRDVILAAEEDGRFTLSVTVNVSPQFFAWLFGFGADVELLSPDDVRKKFYNQLEETMLHYN